MLWPKALPLDLDFGLCAWAKLFKNILAHKKLGQKNFWVKKNVVVKKKIGRNFFEVKKICVRNFLGSKKICVGKLVWPNSILVFQDLFVLCCWFLLS